MKKKTKDNKSIVIFGIKINSGVLVATIILVVFLIFYSIRTIDIGYKLENDNTEIVAAKIIDVGIRRRGGIGVKTKIGYIKFRYSINGKEVTHFSDSFHIRDNIEQYRIGDCIELLVSLENENVYKWNESKGSFKCQ